MKSVFAHILIMVLCCAPLSLGQDTPPKSKPTSTTQKTVELRETLVTGQIADDQLALQVTCVAVTDAKASQLRLLQGAAVLASALECPARHTLRYDPNERAYNLLLSERGQHAIRGAFRIQVTTDSQTAWRTASVQIPAGQNRKIEITAAAALEVTLPGALRVEVSREGDQQTIRGILRPQAPLTVQWKPQVQLTDAKLVWSSHANTIVEVRAGHLAVDTVIAYEITQGQVQELRFQVPQTLSVTSVVGSQIRQWELTENESGQPELTVTLSRSQDRQYHLQIQGQTALDRLPLALAVPVVRPASGIRSTGHVMVGTNSALQLVVDEAVGLTQIDGAAFPRVKTTGSMPRSLPQGKAFYYTYTGNQFALRLAVDDIVPSFDVAGRHVITLKEEDLFIDTELELEIRDAPLRYLDVTLPAGFTVAAVEGQQVEDYQTSAENAASDSPSVRVLFSEPVVGHSLIKIRLERGQSPLGQAQAIVALQVREAKTERGYVVITTETGLELAEPQAQNLRPIHTAALPLQVARAQFAYRFRRPEWSLSLQAQQKPAGIRAEVFHLQSIGETLAHGSAVINLIITGAPVDELSFQLPAGFSHVEFVGRDVRRWTQVDDRWQVTLNRKALGDYSLAVTYTQSHSAEQPIQLGALSCVDAQTQTGFVAVTSHLDLKLESAVSDATTAGGLRPISVDELPASYRLLTSSPILATYAYVTTPHETALRILPYQRSPLLPVVIDIASHQTELTCCPDGRVESVTTVQYKVKNTSGQFLPLTLPAEAQVWGVSHLELLANGTERNTPLAASHDRASGELLVPLRRQLNPNDPMTIRLTYGQIHEPQGSWQREVQFTAPRCTVPVTYADWQVSVPNAWALLPTQSTMRAETRPVQSAGLSTLMNQVGRGWTRALSHWLRSPAVWLVCTVALTGMALVTWRQRAWVPTLMALLLLACLVWIGLMAAQRTPLSRPAPITVLKYSQAVSTDPHMALTVGTRLVPTWRQHLRLVDGIVVGSLLVVLALAAWRWRKLRLAALAAGFAAFLYLAAQLPAAWPGLKAMLTWLIPMTTLAGVLLKTLGKRIRTTSLSSPVPTVTSVLVLTALLAFGGCTGTDVPGISSTAALTVENIDCQLNAERDSMEVRYVLTLHATRAGYLPLTDSNAILVSSPHPAPHVRLALEDDRHRLVLERAGRYTVEAVFLLPLPQPDSSKRRHFELPLPVALANHVALTIPDANIVAQVPQALFVSQHQTGQQTEIEAMFAPGQSARFAWRPRERQAAEEDTRFYAQDHALAQVRSGLVQVTHAVQLQIAQGQVSFLRCDIPAGEVVTAVHGPHIGAWRFDPALHQLELRLAKPAISAYTCILITEASHASVPYAIDLQPVRVQEAVSQQSRLGLATHPSVYVRLKEHPATINTRDFLRDNQGLLEQLADFAPEMITQAFRFETGGPGVLGDVLAVKSELRSRETGRFNIEDDRLVYNSQWDIEITKASRFGIDLEIPAAYDIDTLAAEPISHWDDTVQGDTRLIHVHFKHLMVGTVSLKLALSQPVSEIPTRPVVPRVSLVGSLKHGGQLLVGADQGLRLSVASRKGVSETDPAELGLPEQEILAFRLLRPDWELVLASERVQPRITVQTLHVAHVTEGLIQHQHTLRYRHFHAGSKHFRLELPPEATGVTLSGAGIARREQLSPTQWQVELADKVYERPYLLRVRYETQYLPQEGQVVLTPMNCLQVDQQEGYTVLYTTDRVELSVDSLGSAYRPADARHIPKVFGAGDLSEAVMCLRSVAPDQNLVLQAIRHHAAPQVGADVQQTHITTVLTESGDAIHQVRLTLQVTRLHHLRAILPEGTVLWSLSVDGQAIQPSLQRDGQGEETLLIPLPQQAADHTVMEMVYVGTLPVSAWSGAHQLAGPRFDLPLKQIAWQVYVPEDYRYHDFGGTLTHAPGGPQQIHAYDMKRYDQQRVEINLANEFLAQKQQSLAHELAETGRQDEARQALTKGYRFSLGNRALNEDIRVDLDNMLRRQVKVGLVNARDRLRQQASGQAPAVTPGDTQQGQEFALTQAQVDRLENKLGQADSENLELITQRIIQTQEAATASLSQLQITLPLQGRVLSFTSPLQVENLAPMHIGFQVKRQQLGGLDPHRMTGIATLVALLLLGGACHSLRPLWRHWQRRCLEATPPVQPVQSNETVPSTGPVSADDLLD